MLYFYNAYNIKLLIITHSPQKHKLFKNKIETLNDSDQLYQPHIFSLPRYPIQNV